MSEKNPLTKIDLDFTVRNRPIDYFHIDCNVLSMDEFDVSEIDLNLASDQYLTMEHLTSIDHDANETIVFNIPVGKGKTERCYDLIRKYYTEGYYVIVCSPFQKLVEKDYDKLKEGVEVHEIFPYNFIEGSKNEHRSSLTWGVEARIQIMTINCLLGNPGEDQYEQAFVKRDFLNYLFQVIHSKGKKIVFFFDEIHEAVHNFKNEFIPRMIKWHSLTHKCYISSATHTPASIPIIRYISLLTQCKIKIYFTNRYKNAIQAGLHLHISTETYSQNKLSPLNKIIELIHNYTGRKINILSGYRSIIEALVSRHNTRPLANTIRKLNPNICTSLTLNEFDQSKNNIGTNFKTGVNIDNNRGVLIIVLPVINNDKSSYGIFQDGVPSIIQSLGRLRNGGDIHIFLYAPNSIIDIENHRDLLDESLYLGKSNSEFLTQTEGYSLFREIYDRKVKGIETELSMLKDIGLEEVSPELKYHYPTFQEELINRSQLILQKRYEIFGKGLSSYVLWSAINNQFCNATLRNIELITKSYKTIQLTSSNLPNELVELLSNEQRLILKTIDFKTAHSNIWGFIKTSITTMIDEEKSSEIKETIYNKFTLDGVKKDLRDLSRGFTFNQGVVSMISFLKTSIMQDINKEKYIHTCIQNAIDYNEVEIPDIIDGYRSLNFLREEFIEFISNESVQNKAHEKLIHIESYSRLDDVFIADSILAIIKIKANDYVFKSSFSFLQDIENIFVVNLDIKRRIWLEFKKLFTSIGDERRTYDKEKKYYLVPEVLKSNYVISSMKFI